MSDATDNRFYREKLPEPEVSEVERVAIAICRWNNYGVLPDDSLAIWARLGDDYKNAYRDQAEAAIVAMNQRVTAPVMPESFKQWFSKQSFSLFAGQPVCAPDEIAFATWQAAIASMRPTKPVSGLVPGAIPTETMCDNARGFILGLDLGIRTWGAMKKHLSHSTYPSCARVETQGEIDPKGHITKWDIAECIYVLMTTPSSTAQEQGND